jgi:hypothetical protein
VLDLRCLLFWSTILFVSHGGSKVVVAHLDHYMPCLSHVLYGSLSSGPYAGSSLGVDLLPPSAPLLDVLTLDC